MPRISFILPIYKVEQYLPRAIDSLKNQTCGDWEAILVDDGSPDGCGALCDKAASEDSRFKAVHRENGGIGLARNSGMDAAKGEYIHFYDPDDEIAPDFVEKICAAADSSDADVIYFAYSERYFDENGAQLGEKIIEPPLLGTFTGEPFKDHFDDLTTLYYAWSKVIRRSIAEEHHVRFTQVKLVEDGVFYAKYFAHDPAAVTLISDKLYMYTMGRTGSAIGSYHKERADEGFVLSQTIEGVLKDWGLLDSPMHYSTLCYCYVRDLQLSIKNMSLSPLSMRERTAWLKGIMKEEKIKKAVANVPPDRILSRNDKIKLILLKRRMYGAVMMISGLNNR